MTVVSAFGRLALAVLTALTLAACGAPTGSPAQTLESVPYDLSAPSTSARATATPAPSRGPQVYLVRDEALLAASAVPQGGDVRDTAIRALDQLVDSPNDQDRMSGLSTALGPDVRLSLSSLSNGRATVDIRAGEQAPGAGRLPLAVGQVVLTLTSVGGVDEVVLTSDGVRIAAPLPGGALTDRPLRARDYAELIVATTPPTAGPDAPTSS